MPLSPTHASSHRTRDVRTNLTSCAMHLMASSLINKQKQIHIHMYIQREREGDGKGERVYIYSWRGAHVSRTNIKFNRKG